MSDKHGYRIQVPSRYRLLLSRGIDAVEKLCHEVRDLRFILHRPGPLQILLSQDSEPMNVLVYQVLLPAVADPRTVSRELSITLGTDAAVIVPVTVDAASVDGLQAAAGATYALSLVEIDAAGNRSQASTLTGTLALPFDLVVPGALAVKVTGETTIPDPAPAAPVDPAAAPAT